VLGTLSASTYVKVRDLGTVTKQRAGSVLRVTVEDTGNVATGHWCILQTRIDGATDAGSTGTAAADDTGDGAMFGHVEYAQPFTSVAQFVDLPAGTHTIQLWARTDGPGAACIENPGGFDHSALVEELT
jgi:hypothetical protein